MNSNTKKLYLKNISKKMNVNSTSSKTFIHLLEQNIDNFLIENPDATYKELEDNFGSANSIVDSYMDSLDSDEFVNHFSYKKKLALIIICIVLVLSVICGGIYAWYYHNLNKEVPSYSVEAIEEIN